MKKNWKTQIVSIWGMASIFYAFVIHCLFSLSTDNQWFIAKWGAGDILTYASTISLGLLAVWQNQKFKEENDKTQERLKDIIEQGNNISIINKIIEYETDNLKRLRVAFQEFSESAEPQRIQSAYVKHRGNDSAVAHAMNDAHNRLYNNYYVLVRELRIDLMVKNDAGNNLRKALIDYYNISMLMISEIGKKPNIKLDKDFLKRCNECRFSFIKVREDYLKEQERKLSKLLYEELPIESIKSMYHRVEFQNEDAEKM